MQREGGEGGRSTQPSNSLQHDAITTHNNNEGEISFYKPRAKSSNNFFVIGSIFIFLGFCHIILKFSIHFT
jgi:hypothetical protein